MEASSRGGGAAALRRATLCGLAAFALSGCDVDHADLGRQRFAARDYTNAVEELGWAVRDNPADQASRLLLAKAQAHTGRRFDAKKNLEEVRKDPALRSEASRHLVLLLLADDDFEAAEGILNAEIALAPEDPVLIELRGLVTAKRADGELETYARSLRKDVGDGPGNWAIRRVKEKRTHPADAAFEEDVAGWARSLEKSHGLSDTRTFIEAARQSRHLALAAQADFIAASTADPTRFLSLIELGRFAIERSDTSAACKHLGALIALDDTTLADAEAKVAFSKERRRAVDILSAHLEESGKLSESVELLDNERANGMLEGAMMERLARQCVDLGAFDKAAVIARELIASDPRNTWASYVRGRVAAHEGRDHDAVTYLNRAQVQLPANPVINAALARALVKVGRDTQASAHFRAALRGPLARDLELTLEYAETMARESDPAHAAQFLAERLSSPFNQPASKEHQRILDEIERYSGMAGIGAETLADARRALVVNPRNAFAKLLVARHEHAQGLSEIAMARCKEITEQFPGLADGWLLMAQILTDLDRDDEAAPALAKAGSLRPDDPNIPWLQGKIDLERKRIDAARRNLTRALEIDSALAGPRLDLVEVEILARNFEEVNRHCTALSESYPSDPLVHRACGLAKLAMQDPTGAIEPLSKAVAALPADLDLRIRLGTSRIEAGRVEEGREDLLAVGRSAEAARAIRVEAAEALRRARLFGEAAAIYELLFDTATDEDERRTISEKLFWARLWAWDFTGALDELVEMRLAGRKTQAERIFVVAAERLRFYREAGAQADILRAAGEHDATSLASAHRSHARLKEWHKAIEDLADLGRLEPALAEEIAIDRALALIGIGKLAEAEEIARKVDPKDDGLRSKALGLRLAIAIDRAEPAAISGAASDLLAHDPRDFDARMSAARALTPLAGPEEAARLLLVTPFRAANREDTVAAAAILVAAGNPRAAAALADSAPDRGGIVGETRALVSVLIEEDPPEWAHRARILRALARKDFEQARGLLPPLTAPESEKQQILAIVGLAESFPESAPALAMDLARERVFTASGILADRADAILRSLAERAGAAALPFDLLRAWSKLESGNPRAAADIVVPMLETKASTAMVHLIAALAGNDDIGESSALKVLDGAPAPVPRAFVSDLFHGLAARGKHDAALRVSSRLDEPGDRDHALRLLLAVERSDLADARRHFGAVAPAWRSRPQLRAAAAWVAVQGEKSKARDAALAELDDLARDPRELARLDVPLLYEAALLAGRSKSAAAILAHGLEDARFDAGAINRFADVLRRLQIEESVLRTLDSRLRVVDPSGKIRATGPRPLAVD